MPAKSKAQQHLFQAAAHGADFPKANALRASMPVAKMHDFEVGSMKNLPQHVGKQSHPIRNLKHFAHPPKKSR